MIACVWYATELKIFLSYAMNNTQERRCTVQSYYNLHSMPYYSSVEGFLGSFAGYIYAHSAHGTVLYACMAIMST